MEKLDAFTRYLGNCGLFHFFDAIQKWVLVFTGIIVFVLTIATVFLRYVLTMNVLGLDEIILGNTLSAQPRAAGRIPRLRPTWSAPL